MNTSAGTSARWRVAVAAGITRRVPAFPGRWRVLRWLRGQSAALALMPPLPIRTPEGTLLLVDAWNNRDFYVDPDTFSKDDAINDAFERLLRPGDVVLDVGANLGRMSLHAARLVGRDGVVHAFEPCPKVAGSLWRNLQASGATQVKVWPLAASDRAGLVEFQMPVGTNSGWASMRDLGAGAAITIKVAAMPLDELEEIWARPPRLVKLDVEGAELLALSGMRQSLARHRPVVLLELTDAWLRQLGSSAEALLELMRGLGYSAWQLGSGVPQRLETSPEHQVDALFLPRAEESLLRLWDR